MTPRTLPRQSRHRLVSRAINRAKGRSPAGVRRAATVLATALGVVLATGLMAAATTLGFELAPARPGEVTAMVLIVAAGLVSSGIVVAFWRHLVESLAGEPGRRPPRRRRPGSAIGPSRPA
jgi:hypothetical protein